jgi:SpoVK/Ycf46/Vps4 family AAA+-type ATPase
VAPRSAHVLRQGFDRVFDYAERANAVLLFDEADALFAKRTDVGSSNDRYANLAVNHLLQRLERYSGVGILTTNKEAALDSALARRLSLQLRFALPAPGERERLWRSMLLPTMPLGHDIDVAELARRYELAGGDIRNIVLRAAFVAAGRGGAIDMATLRHSVALELEDRGRVVQRIDGEVADGDEPAAPPPAALVGADTTYCESTHDFIDG